MLRAACTYGASVRGPLHTSERRPNEDAWLRADGFYGSMIVVCDGIGSRVAARLGAHSACQAAREAVARWSRAGDPPISYLLHLVEVLWRIRIHPTDAADASTTCLLALARNNGELIVAGLGDGLAMTRTAGDSVDVLIGLRQNGFSNETVGLGASPGLKAWNVSRLSPTAEERVAVLATDGVADDMRPDKLDDFCAWLVDDFRTRAPADRWRLLTSELRDWPTPNHQDDKTIAVLCVPAMSGKNT